MKEFLYLMQRSGAAERRLCARYNFKFLMYTSDEAIGTFVVC